jgi:hypothetical protein|tara:strand:- start:3314 stop:3517 length:204 start_codon:yes stop_codon:yes gene_type:complete
MATDGARGGGATATDAKKNDGRTIWSYRDECQTWRNYDASKGLRYTRESIDAVRSKTSRARWSERRD